MLAIDPAERGKLVHIELEDLPEVVQDRLLDHFLDETVLRVVDELVQPWSRDRELREDRESQLYYLPLQGNLL